MEMGLKAIVIKYINLDKLVVTVDTYDCYVD